MLAFHVTSQSPSFFITFPTHGALETSFYGLIVLEPHMFSETVFRCETFITAGHLAFEDFGIHR